MVKADDAGLPALQDLSNSRDWVTAAADYPALAVPFSLLDPGHSATIPAALAWTAAEGAEAPDPLEQQGVDSLAEAFLDQVEPHAGSTNSLSYQQAWKSAQEQADIAMKAQYGGQAWLLRHRSVHRQAMANALESVQPPEPLQ